jgi:hypothetical protein
VHVLSTGLCTEALAAVLQHEKRGAKHVFSAGLCTEALAAVLQHEREVQVQEFSSEETEL